MARPTLLVVDDNQAFREACVLALARAGYRLLQAADGYEAVQLARLHRPDLILLDLELPALSGWATRALLREHAATREIPVAAVTALALPDLASRLREAGFCAYLAKPVRLASLLRAVESCIEGSGGRIGPAG